MNIFVIIIRKLQDSRYGLWVGFVSHVLAIKNYNVVGFDIQKTLLNMLSKKLKN